MAPNLFSRRKSRGSVGRESNYAPADKVKLSGDPLAKALQQNRLGLVLAQRAGLGDDPHFKPTLDAAAAAVDEKFALVPEGVAAIPLTIFDQPGEPETEVQTEPYLIALYAVTNADYQHFVDDGAYDDLELWPEEIWPHLIGFKDQSDHAGPRFWRVGRHDRRLANHPVVGISYYEALAYAGWAGLRLPTEAEWQMAASWRVRGAAQAERRYPWGDSLELDRCNIWASGHGGTVPVDACAGGAAPNGVRQLIGNVWEWTSSDFSSTDRAGRSVVGESAMKGVRGGAYDTYFPWQATAAFRTGLTCLSRVHNVGMRCALDLPADEE